MTPERWRRIEQLFDELADLPPLQQDARLERACVDAPELLEELRRLLAHDRGPNRIAEIIEGVSRLPPPEETSFEGRRLGPWRIVGELGRGGMGVVFEAVRDDDAFEKRVALKVAARAAYSPEFVERFRQERRILARLDHPHIARLLDGGTTEEGVPFFVMELVRGEPIHDYAIRRGMPAGDRLRLFLQVCEAVEFAHQNLVVHRDLKPSNILVCDGSVRLLDFGVAKLLDAADPNHTMTGLLPITPDYCSPEQVRGLSITTRTDVYSLGLVLYELLTGERAQKADTSSPSVLDRSISDTPIVPPSERARTRGERSLARQLRGDLDTIVLTATRKEPERRYSSAAALAEDLRSHLASRPIRARQDSAWYLAGKFARRHWLGLATSALVAASLLGGIVSTTYQARRAQRRFDQVRRIANALLVDVHDAIRDLPASTKAQEVVIRTALDYLDGLAREAAGDPELQIEIAEGYLRVGQLAYAMNRASLGSPDEARRSYEKAGAILGSLQTEARDPVRVAVATTRWHRLTGELLYDTTQSSAALESFERAIQAAESALASGPENPDLLEALAEAQSAMVSRFDGSPVTRRYVSRYLDVAERLARQRPETAGTLHELGVAYSQAGKLAASDGDLEQARGHYLRNVDLQSRAVAIEPNNVTLRRDLMLAWSNVADLALGALGTSSYTGAGGPPVEIDRQSREQALAASQKTLEQSAWIYERDPENDAVAFDYAISLGRMAPAYPPKDPDAIATLQQSLDLLERLKARNPGPTSRFLVEFHGSLAERYRQAGNLAMARRQWSTVDELVRAAIAKDPESYYPRRQALPIFVNWARTLALAGDAAGAREIARRVEVLAAEVAEREAQYVRAPGWPPRAKQWLVPVYEAMGDARAAEGARAAAVDLWRAVEVRSDLPADLIAEARAALRPPGTSER